MRLKIILLPLLLIFVGSCTTPERGQTDIITSGSLFPTDGFITQRAIFTARGRQFALNGYLAMSETGGERLIVTETFGNVMADLLIKPDCKVYVLRSSRMFPEKYIRRLMAGDVLKVFSKGNDPRQEPFITMPESNHFILDRGGYKLDLRILEIKPGIQPASMFDESAALKK